MKREIFKSFQLVQGYLKERNEKKAGPLIELRAEIGCSREKKRSAK